MTSYNDQNTDSTDTLEQSQEWEDARSDAPRTGPHGENLMTMREWLDGYRAGHPVHILVVTEDPCGCKEPCDCEPEFTYSIECPGVTDGCRTWWECPDCSNAIQAGDEDREEELERNGQAHGVEHRRLEHGWSTPSEDCWGQHCDSLPDAVEDLFRDGPKPGRYRVRLLPDDQYLTLDLVTDESEAKLDEALTRHETRQA